MFFELPTDSVIHFIKFVARYKFLKKKVVTRIHSAQQRTGFVNAAQVSAKVPAYAVAAIQIFIERRLIEIATTLPTLVTVKHY